ncbi:MAG: hypothetical protein LBS91_05810 [Clostridiales Family XIII bacterium]|jgi:hypothetical protein|nr:hypothetical protein [Clostridiales Family XIII bacterium]
MISGFFTGQYKILAWFIVAIIVVYIPAWAVYLHHRKQKADAYIKRRPDAAAVKIARSKVNDILTVHSVDGENPVFFSQGTYMYFYLAPGRHMLSLAYHWTKSSVAAKLGAAVFAYENFDAENAEIAVEAKPNKQYQIRYDHEKKAYCFEEA